MSSGEDPSADPDGGIGADEALPTPERRALRALARTRISEGRDEALRRLEKYRRYVLVDVAVRVVERDAAAAGSVVGSAVALRLFLFFVPLVLFAVGLTGFFTDLVTAEDVEAVGVTGALAGQIDTALSQPTSTRWLAVGTGLVGMAWSGRTLSKTVCQASCLAWQLPVRAKASARLIGGLIGLIVGVGLIGTLVDRIREALGLGAAGVSFVAAAAVYAFGWLVLSSLIPRPTSDPGVLLPGAALVGVVVASLQAVSTLYLPGQFSRASELYGAIGITLVTLGWFFIAGRTMVLSLVVNAAVFERFGSASRVLFELPGVRRIPRRWPAVGRWFDL